MSDNKDKYDRSETNFRLSILATRQMGERLDQRMDRTTSRLKRVEKTTSQVSAGLSDVSAGLSQVSAGLSQVAQQLVKLAHGVDQMSQDMGQVSVELHELRVENKTFGAEIRVDFHELADQQERMAHFLGLYDDDSPTLGQEIADLKRRVAELEERAS